MDRKFLEDLALEKDVIDKIMNENGKDIEKAKGGSEELKESNQTLEREKTTLEEQLKTANDKIDELSKVDAEKLQEEIADYKKKFEDSEQAKKEELKKLTLEHEVEKALIKGGAKNMKAVKALLDFEKINNTNELTKELDTQLKALAESDGYLFESKEEAQSENRVKVTGKGGDEAPLSKPQTYSEMMAALNKK